MNQPVHILNEVIDLFQSQFGKLMLEILMRVQKIKKESHKNPPEIAPEFKLQQERMQRTGRQGGGRRGGGGRGRRRGRRAARHLRVEVHPQPPALHRLRDEHRHHARLRRWSHPAA